MPKESTAGSGFRRRKANIVENGDGGHWVDWPNWNGPAWEGEALNGGWTGRSTRVA
jgi:hypothetical protein